MSALSEPAGNSRAPREVAAPAGIDAVVTHHRDGFRSGVARFNELLAQHLRVPVIGLFDGALQQVERPLFSFKFSELGADEAALSDVRWDRAALYLHDFAGSELERQAVYDARWVHCGNPQIHEQARQITDRCDTVWTPGLLVDNRSFEPTEISVFSFGMAHKLRTKRFARLRELLERSGRSYALYVSAANHETASLRDAQVVFEEMHDIFPRRLYFLGNLSDVAVHNYLEETTFFAAFFPGGVRSNNTSVASAMERGAVVITNLDRHSPPEFVHMDNVIDIDRCDELPADPLVLGRISVRAMETARERGWDRLVERLRVRPGRGRRVAPSSRGASPPRL
jgi:hypothetical protein